VLRCKVYQPVHRIAPDAKPEKPPKSGGKGSPATVAAKESKVVTKETKESKGRSGGAAVQGVDPPVTMLDQIGDIPICISAYASFVK